MRPGVLLVVLLMLTGLAPLPSLHAQTTRLVAIGDIHGSIDGFTAILNSAGLASHGTWVGGRTHLVQTGDYTDRGAGQRAVMDLLMSLESQAKDADGRLTVLLGNHEVMNLIGELRDVTREIFATFADADSDRRREEAWQAYAKLAVAKQRKGETVPTVYAQTREAWMTTHPRGFVEYMEAMGPRGKYGRWLRDKDVVAKAGDSIFMHAGISPANAPTDLDDINTRARAEITRMDRFRKMLVDHDLATPEFTLGEVLQVASAEIGMANAIIAAAKAEGKEPDRRRFNAPLLLEAQEILKIDSWMAVNPEAPLWYRGFATLKDDPTGGPIAVMLQQYGAKRFVTAHTPQANRSITSRFGGRVFLIDTGMLATVYNGRPSALEIAGDTVTAIYEDSRSPFPRTK